MAVRDIEFAKPLFGDAEREAVNRVMATPWLASGPETELFEAEFASLIGARCALAVNSGSSANLLALAALNLPKGSKVLTSGCGFPATLAPILHLGLEPVLVDYEMGSFNIDLDAVERRIREVKAIIFAHTMGNPVDMIRLSRLAGEHGVYVIEDCCEALGATVEGHQVGSCVDMGTFSFYPSHQITALGGGGMVTFHDEKHYQRARSMRDWGKIATWDKLGRNDTAYTTEVDGIPYFSHYTYSTIGFNMRLPDANSAFGRVQLKRLDAIVHARRHNHDKILAGLSTAAKDKARTPQEVKDGAASWFGVAFLVQAGHRRRIGDHLESLGVRHRPFFAGNITRHDAFRRWRQSMEVADALMERGLFVGCWAGMSDDDCQYVAGALNEAIG